MSDIYTQEYNNCMASGQYDDADCSRFARCVHENNLYTEYLCGTDQWGVVQCAGNDPMQLLLTETYCYSQLTKQPPQTYPGTTPVDENNPSDDPPVDTDPPTQVPPCDTYFDCKSSKDSKSSCNIL